MSNSLVQSCKSLVSQWWFWVAIYVLAHLPKLFWGDVGIDFKVYLSVFEEIKDSGPFAAYKSDALGFTYGPFALLLLSPLSWFDSARVGFVLWSLVSWTALFANIGIIFSWLKPSKSQALFTLLMTFIVIERFFDHNVNYGQSNLFILLFVLLSLQASLRHKPMWTGLWMGLAISFKLTPALFVLLFFFNRQKAEALWSIAFALVLNVGASIWLAGGQWVDLLLSYREALAYLSGVYEIGIENYSVKRFFLTFFSGALGKMFFYAFAGVSLGLTTWVLQKSPKQALMHWSLIFLLMLLLSPVTWIHHYVMLLVPVIVLSFNLVQSPKQVFGWLCYLSCALLMTGTLPLSGGFTLATFTLLLPFVLSSPRRPYYYPQVLTLQSGDGDPG